MPSTEQEEYLYSYKTYPALRSIPPHCKHQAIRAAVTSPQFAAKSKEQNKIYGGEYKGQLGEVEYTILEQPEPPGFFPGRLWRVRGLTPRLKARTDAFTQAYGTD